MSERSEWSRELLDGDGPATISVTLEDGSRRQLQVSRVEHEQFAEAGTPITTRFERARAGMRRHGWRVARWIAAAAIAAAISTVISTRVTTYYADREQAITLKASLVSTISRGVVRANHAALGVADVAARAASGEPAAQARRRARDAWGDVVAEVDPLMFLHCHGSTLDARWEAYSDALYAFIDLSHVGPDGDRSVMTDYLRRYFDGRGRSSVLTDRSWKTLACTKNGCSASDDWRNRYRQLGGALMTERGPLTTAFLNTNAGNLG